MQIVYPLGIDEECRTKEVAFRYRYNYVLDDDWNAVDQDRYTLSTNVFFGTALWITDPTKIDESIWQ